MYEGDLRLTIYTKQALSPTVLMHVRLLSQLVGYFYQAKQREQTLRDITRMQAVYETGSRLTHDLKNMLQSLLSLSSIAQSKGDRAQQLLRQQLPFLSQRIEQIMVKLQQPQSEEEAPMLALSAWWDSLRMRNQHHQIVWKVSGALPESSIPAAMFDCVLDNLLDNAIRKQQMQPGIQICVELHVEKSLHISVCDNGSAVPEGELSSLLHSVVVSNQGLGIGLYQAAKWAEQLGYRLILAVNKNGKVRFDLLLAG